MTAVRRFLFVFLAAPTVGYAFSKYDNLLEYLFERKVMNMQKEREQAMAFQARQSMIAEMTGK